MSANHSADQLMRILNYPKRRPDRFTQAVKVGSVRCGRRGDTPQRGVPTKGTMHYQIGVTPDRTGEMQIIRFCQTVMSERLRIVAGTFETFEQSDLQRLFFGLSADFGKQSLQFRAMG
jgi:hypothetical protein